jgi:DNA-binding transcriptional ArsR family regulator
MPDQLDPLTLPTDREILQVIDDQNRFTPKLVGLIINKDPGYMSSELRKLESLGYVTDPAKEYQITDDRSGMYTLTPLGDIVRYHLHTYVRDHHRTFHTHSRLILENQPNNAFYPDLVVLDEPTKTALHELSHVDGVTIPSELHIELSHDADYAPQTAGEALYTLSYHGLAERVEEMDVYRITDRGTTATNLLSDDDSDPVALTETLRDTYSDAEQELLQRLTDEHHRA